MCYRAIAAAAQIIAILRTFRKADAAIITEAGKQLVLEEFVTEEEEKVSELPVATSGAAAAVDVTEATALPPEVLAAAQETVETTAAAAPPRPPSPTTPKAGQNSVAVTVGRGGAKQSEARRASKKPQAQQASGSRVSDPIALMTPTTPAVASRPSPPLSSAPLRHAPVPVTAGQLLFANGLSSVPDASIDGSRPRSYRDAVVGFASGADHQG